MKVIVATFVLFALVTILPAQNSDQSWFTNSEYKLQDGHSLTLRTDGKIVYDGNLVFERYEDKTMQTESYIPYLLTVKDKKGNVEKVYAALEMHELKSTGKIWFVIYEGSFGAMRQTFFTIGGGGQAAKM